MNDLEDNFISGIYNYCDRWCERCSFTSRCRVFAMEQEEVLTDEERDVTNEAFWKRLAGIFAEAKEKLREKAEELGIDLDAEPEFSEAERREAIRRQDLVKLAEKYAHTTSEILENDSFAISIDDDIRAELLQIIRWYQFQIAAKIFRGSDAELDLADEPESGLVRDSVIQDKDGSIKVALIGIDRSISAWSALLDSYTKDIVKPMIALLENIRRETERKFPNARNFVRPGFDEIETVM